LLEIKKQIRRLWSIHPTIYSLLKDASTPHNARNILLSYIGQARAFLNKLGNRIEPLEYSIQNQCLLTLRKIISVRSERITRFKLVKLLWSLVHEKTENYPSDLSDGFFEEMARLFLGIHGKSGIYDHEYYPDFADIHGRKASILRSNQLDIMAEKTIQTINKYPHGLQNSIIRRRNKNRERILKKLNASETDWTNHVWQLRHVARNVDQLAAMVPLTEEERTSINKANEIRLPFGVTPYYASLMDETTNRRNDHAVRAQVIPPPDYVEYMKSYKSEDANSHDFMLEHDTSPIDLITRRYPHIAILKPCNICSQTCVYCQRNWEISGDNRLRAMANRQKIERAIEWISEHSAITEILVTGGDPLILRNEQLEWILDQLCQNSQLERIRIGTRIPITLPMRITDILIQILSRYHVPGKREIVIVTHCEHPYEVTPETMEAVQKFKKAGLSVYNQAVFTTENSRRFEMAALRKILRLIGVDAYYTFNTKGKEETKSYRVPMARLQQEITEEARIMPGLDRTDEPVYNVPGLGKNYLRAQQDHTLLTILPNGRRIYEFHPWEKKLALADTYIDTDISIYDYLQELKRRGENPEDYNTIWYYY